MVPRMETFAVKKYIGDDEFLNLLRMNTYTGTIDLVKATILGVQCSLNRHGVSTVLDFIRGKARRDMPEELVFAVEGLWYLLYGSADFPESSHIMLTDISNDREASVSFVHRQIEAGEEFLNRLHLGGFDERIDKEKLGKIYTMFTSNLELLRALEKSMREKWTEEEFSNMEKFNKKLESFTAVMWKTMVTIKNMMKDEKLKLLKNRAIIGEIEQKLGQPVRRNDSCPCGSGRKYKNCCGS